MQKLSLWKMYASPGAKKRQALAWSSHNSLTGSAVWQVQEYPGLLILRQSDSRTWQIQSWIGEGIAHSSQARSILENPVLAQQFNSRQDALQALEFCLTQSED